MLVILFVSRGIRSTGKVGLHPYPPSSLTPSPLTLPPSPPRLGAGRTVCEPRDPVHRQGGFAHLPPLLTPSPLTLPPHPHPSPYLPHPLAWVLVVLFVSRGIRSTGKVGLHPYPPSSLTPSPPTLPPHPHPSPYLPHPLAWVLVVLFVSRGIRSTGKVGLHPYPPSSLTPSPLTLPPSPPHPPRLGAGRTVCEPRNPVHRQGGSPPLPPPPHSPPHPYHTSLTPSPGCWSYCL